MDNAKTTTNSNEAIGRALGRIPSGCAIMTARLGPQRTAMLVSWIQQAGFEPPAISVAVKKGRPIEGLIDGSGEFVLNLLPENPMAMFKHFGRGFALDQDAFAGLAVSEVTGGIALRDSIARLSGRVRAKHDSGDHWLYVAEVVEAETQAPAQPYVHLRKNGLNY